MVLIILSEWIFYSSFAFDKVKRKRKDLLSVSHLRSPAAPCSVVCAYKFNLICLVFNRVKTKVSTQSRRVNKFLRCLPLFWIHQLWMAFCFLMIWACLMMICHHLPMTKCCMGVCAFDWSSDKRFKVDSDLNVSDTDLCSTVAGKP